MRIVLASLVALLMPVSLAAQDADGLDRLGSDMQTGTRFKMAPETPTQGKAREMQKVIARCVTYRNKKLVREILAKSDPSQIAFGELSVGSKDLGEKLKVGECMSRAMSASTIRLHMRFNYQTFRNLFAEEVYLMDVKEPLVIAEGEAEKLENRYFVGGMANPMAETMSTMADCISFRAPNEADGLLRTRPGTAGEREAAAMFLPAAGQCFGDIAEGDIDVSMVRKIAADGMWSRHHYRTQNEAS